MAARRGDDISVRLRVALPTARPLGARAVEHFVEKSVNARCCFSWIMKDDGALAIVVRRFPSTCWAAGRNSAMAGIRSNCATSPRSLMIGSMGLEPGVLTPLVWQAVSLGVLGGALRRAVSDSPARFVAQHGDLCLDPAPRFEALAASVGLTLSAESLRFLADSDRDGSGYHTQRPTAAVPHRWREQFDTAEIDAVRAVLDRFPASAGWHGWFDAAP